MQSHPHDASRNYSYQRHHQSSLPPTHAPNYVDPNGQPMGYHPVAQNAQVQRSTYGHPHDPHHPATNNSCQQPRYCTDAPYRPTIGVVREPPVSPQHYAVDLHHAGVLLNPGVPVHYQNYRPIERGQPVVPSQYDAHLASQQKPYPNPPNPAIQTQGGHAQYSNPATSPSPPIGYGSPSPPSSSSSSSPHACNVCGATFTRPHDRKRHYESQHTTIEHVCQYCRKSYARVDSLKRHLDRPCDKMPQSAQKGT